MKISTINNPTNLTDLEKSILESKAYQNKYISAKEAIEKNRENLIKRGIISK
jgi:hypothetical protein